MEKEFAKELEIRKILRKELYSSIDDYLLSDDRCVRAIYQSIRNDIIDEMSKPTIKNIFRSIREVIG